MSELATEARIVEKALIFNDRGKVLVINENPTKVEWDLPGGGREKGESRIDTLARELGEELGIRGTITVGDILGSATFYLFRRGTWVTQIFSRVALSSEDARLAGKREGAAFVPISELDSNEMFQSLIRLMANRAIKG